MKLRNLIKIIILTIFLFFNYAFSQPVGQIRVAILPFENADGRMEYNIWSYQLQDSLAKYLISKDPNEFNYRIVPIDSIEILLAELNINPYNPQYASDMWKVVEKLNCQKVISGNFNIQHKESKKPTILSTPEL